LKKRKRSLVLDIPKESRRLYVELVIKNILTAVDIVNARITRLEEEYHEVTDDSDAVLSTGMRETR
jgi:phage terminase Nu1 subunit (DNA packaging protein)